MRHWLRLRKIATRIFAAVCLLFLLTLAVVQIGQHVLRRRAERLLADLRQLHDGGNTWSDMQGLMNRWGKYGHYDGSCTAQKCEYRIDLEDWVGEAAYPSKKRFSLIPLMPFILLAHWHDASLFVDITVGQSRIREWRVHYMTYVPKGDGPVSYTDAPYALMAGIADTSRPSSYYWEWPGTPPHMDYSVTQPSGCSNCISITSNVKPSTQGDTMKRMTNLNLNCITRWSPCIVAADIFPDAWHELEEENKLRHASNDRADHCGFSIEEMTNSSRLILRVSITGTKVRPPSSSAGVDPNYPARLIEVIHGTSRLKPGNHFLLNPEWEGTKAVAVNKGVELILFEESDFDPAETAPCGTIPATAENLARVRRAAKDIPSTPPDQQ